MASIEQLYYCYNVLSEAKEDVGKHTEEFMTIMNGATGETSSKMLALQFLPKFAKFFPQFLSQAFDYQLDLCEDNDVNVRRQSVKHLLEYADIDEKLLLKVTDILIQLCCIDDTIVRECAQKSIETLLSSNPLKVATAAITHLNEPSEASVFVAIDTLYKILVRKTPMSANEEDVTNLKTKLTEIIDECINGAQIKLPLDNVKNIRQYNNLMISFLILLNPSSTKLIKPSDYVEKAISIMSTVLEHMTSVDHLLDLLKMYKLVEPYLLIDITFVNLFILNFVHLKLLPHLSTIKETFQFGDSSESQMFRVLYVILVQEIILLFTYLPVSAAPGCIPLFLNLLSSIIPTIDKFDSQNNLYSDDILIDKHILACYLLGFYYVLYKVPTLDETNLASLNNLRPKLRLILRVINSGSSKNFMGSLKIIPKSQSENTASTSTVITISNEYAQPSTAKAVDQQGTQSRHPQITPPSSPSPEKNIKKNTWNSKNRLIHNKKSAQIYAPPYKRSTQPTKQTISDQSINNLNTTITVMTKALINEPISKSVSLSPYWKSDKFLSAVRVSISSCLADSQICRAQTCHNIFKVVSNDNNLELIVVGSNSTESRVTSNHINTNCGVNSFLLKRSAIQQRNEKVSPSDSNKSTQPVQKKRVAKASRGRGRRR